MNTDNMLILGLTMDYGPFGFPDDYVPDYICNHSNNQGRYSFGNQPAAVLWNLQRLTQTLSLFIPVEVLNDASDSYQLALLARYGQRVRQKFGFFNEQKDNNELLNKLFSLMARERNNYTRTFRMLSETEQHSAQSPLHDEFIDRAAFDDWFTRYRSHLQQNNIVDTVRQIRMKAANSAMVSRNWLAQRAINQAEQGGYTKLHRLHQALCTPLADRDDGYAGRPPG